MVVVVVAARVVVVLRVPVVGTVTLTVPTFPVVSLHRLPLMATLLPPTRGLNSLQSPAPILAPAGAPPQRPKLGHLLPDGPIPILPGVLIQLPMAQ